MSVIEDALRRAELQGHSTPPRFSGAAAATQRPVLKPLSGKSAHYASPPPPAPQVAARTPDSRKTRAITVTPSRPRWLTNVLIVLLASVIFGQLLLDTLADHPAMPSAVVGGGLNLPMENATPEAGLSELAGGSAVSGPIAVDAPPAQSPQPVRDQARKGTALAVDPVAKSERNAEMLESASQRFHVSGVMVSAGKRMAVINDVVVGMGDRVDGGVVRAIDARGVVIEVDGKQHQAPVTTQRRK